MTAVSDASSAPARLSSGLAALEVSRRLRGDGAPRPSVDPGLAGGLHDWLEDALADAVAAVPDAALPLRITKETLTQVLVCEAHWAGRPAPQLTPELVRGTLVDLLFRLWVTTGRIDDPWADALGALQVDGEHGELVEHLETLAADRRRRLTAELERHARVITDRWPVPAPGWLPRTQERVVVPVAGGRTVLSGVLDLALGGPAAERASVCLVEVKSGARRLEHRADLHFYALLETLRSGAPPFRMATFYTSDGQLDVEPVGEDALVGALQRTIAGVGRICRLYAGYEPRRTPNPLCAWCAVLPACTPGQRRVGTAVPRGPHDEQAEDAARWPTSTAPGMARGTARGTARPLEQPAPVASARWGRR